MQGKNDTRFSPHEKRGFCEEGLNQFGNPFTQKLVVAGGGFVVVGESILCSLMMATLFSVFRSSRLSLSHSLSGQSSPMGPHEGRGQLGGWGDFDDGVGHGVLCEGKRI